MSVSAGSRFGPYEILSALGAGGMGEVYRARDTRLDRDVAVKVLPASLAGDPDRLRRFEQEARAAAALNHPNILAVHDVGTHDGQPYIVSELLSGTTLREALAHGALPASKAVDIARQVASGLAAAHAKGVTHRDIKPENLFLMPDGRVKILDLGLAKLREEAGGGSILTRLPASTERGVVLGTVGYMSHRTRPYGDGRSHQRRLDVRGRRRHAPVQASRELIRAHRRRSAFRDRRADWRGELSPHHGRPQLDSGAEKVTTRAG
jgi:serine/threonine protein kinase